MKKTKIEQRIKNAVNAFFENDRENFGENGLSFAGDSALLKQEMDERFNEKGDVLVKILKRTFVFFPGALYLFFGTFTTLAFEFLQNPLTMMMVFLIGSFMTMFGIGNLKNPKYLAIPVSIVAVAIAAFSIFSTFGNIKNVFEYGIYFFPIALIVSFLAKSLADKKDQMEN